MTDKRTGSSHPSARPPLPSIAPPTDDIDAEWGADEIPAAAKVPQLAVTATAAAATASPSRPPTTSPSYPPAPEPPAVLPSSPAAATSTPAASTPAARNPLRKQTLLGMAPVIPRSEPPAPAAPKARSEPPRPSSTHSEPPRPSQPAATAAADNPLRKQTLLGMAPVVAARSEPPAAAAKESSPPAAVAAEPEPAPKAAEPVTSVAALEAAPAATADAVASDAPITRDVAGKSARPEARVAVSALDSEDLPELRARRPRWLLPVAAAAVIGLGVVGLRKLDRPPTPLEPAAFAPQPEAKAATPPLAPQADDSNTGIDPDPTTPTEPEPLKAGSAVPAASAQPASPAPPARRPAAVVASPTPAVDSAAASPDVSADAAAPEVATGETKSINVTSDPPGARMFWRGKEVGTTPFVLEIPVGERRSYELGRSGFVTRKVVIDGSKSDISIGLKPEL